MLHKQQSVLRNYPVNGHARSAALLIRPEIQQYFIERDWDGRPLDRTTRELIYARSKDAKGEESIGTIHDVTAEGKEWFVHSITPVSPSEKPPRVRVGGDDCSQAYDMSLLNVSSMRSGSLWANAVQAFNGDCACG